MADKDVVYKKTRKEALEAGDKFYFTGKACKHGHVSIRKVTYGCNECHQLTKRAYQKTSKYKEKRRTYSKKEETRAKARAYTSKQEVRKKINIAAIKMNCLSVKSATQRHQHWTVSDIAKLLKKNSSGGWLFTCTQLAASLGRSAAGINHARSRYQDKKEDK